MRAWTPEQVAGAAGARLAAAAAPAGSGREAAGPAVRERARTAPARCAP
jgi:hypothetical protein